MIRSKIITQQPKPIESPKIIDIKSVTIEHPKTSYRLSKTLRQAKRSVQAEILIALYVVKQQNVKMLWKKKNAKITKRSHAHKFYASYYDVDILIFFNPAL